MAKGIWIAVYEKIENMETLKKYKLSDVKQAHMDLEGRKILGPAVIIP